MGIIFEIFGWPTEASRHDKTNEKDLAFRLLQLAIKRNRKKKLKTEVCCLFVCFFQKGQNNLKKAL